MEKMEIKRFRYDDTRSSIDLKRETDKELKIHYEGNLDLYFTLNSFDDDPTFYIGKDNYQLYEIFDRLYNEIIDGTIFDDYEDEDEEERYDYTKDNIRFARTSGLVDNDTITWFSDDYPQEAAPFFKIEKLPNSYKITFDINRCERRLNLEESHALLDYQHGFTSIRIRTSGSRYGMFYIPFMRAYRRLHKMELDTPQIHIEEYLLDRRLDAGESLEQILKLTKKM